MSQGKMKHNFYVPVLALIKSIPAFFLLRCSKRTGSNLDRIATEEWTSQEETD